MDFTKEKIEELPIEAFSLFEKTFCPDVQQRSPSSHNKNKLHDLSLLSAFSVAVVYTLYRLS